MGVENKSSEFKALEPLIELSEALLGGTRTMRAAGKKHLPKLGKEDEDQYKKKLAVAVLYPAYAETVSQMVGRVFFKGVERKGIKINEEYLEDFNANADDIDAVLLDPFKHALSFSRAYMLVTAPDGSDAKTKADEKAQNIRPYAVVIHPKQVLGIKREKGKIVEFRYIAEEVVIDADYEETTVKKVYKHTPGQVERFEETDDGFVSEQILEIQAGGKPYPVVPVVELIFEKNQLPLEHLAHLNVKHWQSQSDQDNILEICRKPTMLLKANSDKNELIVGQAIVLSPDEDARWIESSGDAIGAGQESLDKLEAQMQSAGAKLLTRTKLSMTDSQAKEEQSKEISTLRKYANQLEDFAEKVLYFFALFEGKDDGGRIEISGNIDADFDATASMDRVDQGVRNGYVSPQTAFEELQRRGMISETSDWEQEQIRLSAQGEAYEE